jgi:hypothetical protein
MVGLHSRGTHNATEGTHCLSPVHKWSWIIKVSQQAMQSPALRSRIAHIYTHCQLTVLANTSRIAFVRVSSVFANSPQTNTLYFLFPVGNGKHDTVFATEDGFLNTASVYHELPSTQVLGMWPSENILKLDIL